jgi:hypothetical protein
MKRLPLLCCLIISGVFSSQIPAFSKQMLLPNTGMREPGSMEPSQSGAGEIPDNPSTFNRPAVGPPVFYFGSSCLPGLLGTINSRDDSISSNEDFNRSYECFSEVEPDLTETPISGSSGQQAGSVPQPPMFVPNGGLNGIPGIGDRQNTSQDTTTGFGGIGSSSAAAGSSQVVSSG